MELQEQAGDPHPETDLIVDQQSATDSRSLMPKKLREQLRESLTNVTRPLWHSEPPQNLGIAKHGKLKADVLRTLAEFDLGVAVVQTLDKDDKKVEMTMNLFTAIRFATSERVSNTTAERYTHYLIAYLKQLVEGGWNLVPNHHAALHIADMLQRNGPMRGWWMFPYERIIGHLQQMNTNSKMGEHIATAKRSSLTVARPIGGDADSRLSCCSIPARATDPRRLS
jgi:hypothetical protein